MDDAQRRARGCTRADLPPVEWDVSEDLVAFHLGRPPEGADERPVEPLEDGCPGGDQRSALVASLWPYYRRRDGNGGRVPNPLLDRGQVSDLAIRALIYFECEQEACASENLRVEREVLRRRDGS